MRHKVTHNTRGIASGRERSHLKHLVESRAADGEGVRGGRQRRHASLIHVFKLQHGFVTTDSLGEGQRSRSKWK